MTVTFNKGDQIRLTLKDHPQASRTIWLAEDVETGELFTFSGVDFFAPQVPLEAVLSDPDVDVALEVPFDQALPTAPGEYEDRQRLEDREFLLENVPDIDLPQHVFKPWVLNEDGTWTSPDGETRPTSDNWLLVVNGMEFIPWDESYGRRLPY